MTAPSARRLASGNIELAGVAYDSDGDLFMLRPVVFEMVTDRRWIVAKPARRNPRAWQVHGVYSQKAEATAAAEPLDGSIIIEVQE